MSPVANEIIPFLEGIFPFYKYTNPLFMTFFKVPGLHSNIIEATYPVLTIHTKKICIFSPPTNCFGFVVVGGDSSQNTLYII